MKTMLTILILLTLAIGLSAQIKKPKGTVPKPSPKPAPTPVSNPTPNTVAPVKSGAVDTLSLQPKFSQEPFTHFEWDKVPTGFYGNDLLKLSIALRDNFKAKDEFETTAAYEKRIQEAKERSLVGSISTKSTIAFVKECNTAPRAEDKPETVENLTKLLNSLTAIVKGCTSSDYNADSQILTINVPIDRESGDFSNSFKISGPTTISEDTYTARNGFGAEVQVRRSISSMSSFAFDNYIEFKDFFKETSKYKVNDDLSISLNLSPERAKEAKQNLSILYVTSFSEPFTTFRSDRHEPKFNEPRDTTLLTSSLTGRLEQVWLFNRVTGEIYKKIVTIPATDGELSIDGAMDDTQIFILDERFTDILSRSGITAIDASGSKPVCDLMVTFLNASKAITLRSKKKLDKKEQAIVDRYKSVPDISAEITKHTLLTSKISSVLETKLGKLKLGNYYLFAYSTNRYLGNKYWEIPFTLRASGTKIDLPYSPLCELR